jgi:SPP1 gp7 family putative phage head morphogenesis protein
MSVSAVNAKSNRDPTQTTVIRKRYAQRLRGWLGRLNAVIRESIIQDDVFSINQSDPVPPNVFAFPRDDQKNEAFLRWLRKQEQNGLLEIVTRNDNTFIRSSYERGVEHADEALRAEGVDVPKENVSNIFNIPVHQEAVQFLYTRNFEELNGITETMNQRISRELADGFQRGENPTKIARSITDSVNDIGKRRSETLARTEVIRAHSEGTLNRFERFGVDEVTVQAEWTTAGDSRVCPICRALEGRTFTVQKARSGSFTFEDREYPVRPPAHPNCRCALIPVV